jgi:hypothetical protein
MSPHDQDKLEEELAKLRVSPSEAVFAFAAWLTCRPGTLNVGSRHDAGRMAELAGEYIRSQSWSQPRNGVFPHNIEPAP